MLRFVAERQEPVFETIDELRMDSTSRFFKLANALPVWSRVKGELVEHWRREALMGRSLEEYARSKRIIFCEKEFMQFQLFRKK